MLRTEVNIYTCVCVLQDHLLDIDGLTCSLVGRNLVGMNEICKEKS